MLESARAGRGFTLIELLVVVAIVAVMAVAAVPAVDAVTGASARAAAGELAGAARYLFETAALRHETCRLALDLDDSSWWAECTEGRYALPRDAAAAAREEEDAALEERFPDERDAERRRLLARPRFAQFKDRLGRKRSLPGGAEFTHVWTAHSPDPVSKGTAYVYFFPQGLAEAARIPVASHGNVYSVVTQPYTGRARVVTGEPEVPRS
jgi:general secretion pathway protein H